MNEQVIEVRPESSSSEQKEEVAAYTKFLELVKTGLSDMTQVLDTEAVKGVIEAASRQLQDLGGYSVKTVSSVVETFKKDLVSSARAVTPALGSFGSSLEEMVEGLRRSGGDLWADLVTGAEQTFDVWRDRAGSVLAPIILDVSEWTRAVAEKVGESLNYNTGEMTSGGSFVCTSCGTKIRLKKPTHLPPCPKCHNTQFRRA